MIVALRGHRRLVIGVDGLAPLLCGDELLVGRLGGERPGGAATLFRRPGAADRSSI